MKPYHLLTLCIAASTLVSCDGLSSEKNDEAVKQDLGAAELSGIGVSAELIASGTGDGGAVGDAVLMTSADGATLELSLADMKAGEYGMHIHQTGRCEAPDFKSAGGHWNPKGTEHGIDNPKGAHAGDLPNLAVAADGEVKQTFKLKGLTMADMEGLMDEDGAALVIHAGPDDNKTDPSGNSGGRIICGVFR